MLRRNKHMRTIGAVTVFLFTLGIGLALSSHSLNATGLNIALTVKERSGVSRAGEPVSSGIPFSQTDNILSTPNLGIFTENEVEVPAQFRVLSRYNGPVSDTDKPIRVVLVDFKADVTANQETTYYLKDSGSGTASGSNIASEDAGFITLSTGKLIAKISKTNFNLFDEVYIDKDDDGLVNDQMVSSNPADGIIINYQGVDYTSNNAPTEIAIEENGPLRAVVKARGYFKDSQSSLLYPPLGDTGLSYTVRFKAFKDKPYVKVEFRLESENFGWTDLSQYPAHHIYLNSVNLKTTLDLTSAKTVEFDNYQDTFTSANYQLLQDHEENTVDESGNFVYSIDKNGTNVTSGARYNSFADLRDSEKGLMVANRWFWQNWPKAVEVNDNVINYYLWPDMSYDHKFLGGIYKTHELIYDFHSANYNFDSEVATLKKRLVALASDEYYAKTEFLGLIAPENINTDYTFAQGERLDVAIDKYNRKVKAYFLSGYSGETITTLQEGRPLLWSKGLLSGQRINYYGWLDFGDMARFGNYGFPALHYAWEYLSLIHGLRFQNYEMIEIGEQMTSHKADIDIIHDPTGRDEAGSWDEDYYRGGHRYETDAHMQIGDTYASASTNAPYGSSHTWTKGIILQYLLTGDQRYYDVLMQIGEHLVYAFSTGTKPGISCDTDECWGSNHRHQGRAVNNLVDLWKLTGNQQFLSVANNVFVNGLLTKEGSQSNGGYINYYRASAPQTHCGDDYCDSHNFYESIAVEPLINLYYALKDNGRTSDAATLYEFLLRKANWIKNDIYKNYEEAECGTYSGGQYFSYCTKIDWKYGYKWPVGQGSNDSSYSFPFTDNFAFLYRETGDISWLNLARAAFKDYLMYKCGSYMSINYDTNPSVSGFSSSPGSAHLKIGKTMTKPMVYLNTEWKESLGATLSGDVNGNGIVDILDLQACVNVFLGTETKPEYVQRAKQVAEPKDECNVLDVQGIVNIILSP